MKFVHEAILIDNEGFSKSKEYLLIMRQITDAIKSITWPPETNLFTINPIKHGNGVVPIKRSFISHLQKLGWEAERKIDVEATAKTPGKIDVVKGLGNSFFAVEWETGNISSSHRALNKMVIGLLSRKLIGGILILPTRNFYSFLTDRVGNYSELEPYFPLWKAINCKQGILTVIAVEHDHTDKSAKLIPKGTDGRALR